MKKKVLILIYSSIFRQPRILNEIEALSGEFDIVCAGFDTASVEYPNVKVITLSNEDFSPVITTPQFHLTYPVLLRKLFSLFIGPYSRNKRKRMEEAAREISYVPEQLVEKLKDVDPDFIVVHQPECLPLAKELSSGKIPVYFNAHEYYPLLFEDKPEWLASQKPRIEALLHKYLKDVRLLFVVSEKIGELYWKNFGVESRLVKNAKPFYDLKPHPVSDQKIRIIHHGSSIRSRMIEVMIDAAAMLPERFEFSFMLNPVDPQYEQELRKKSSSVNNVFFLDPVPVKEIPVFTNKFDIGLFLLPPTNTNYRYALPNKLFEFVQARLMTVIGPSEEMEKWVRKYNLGMVATDFSAKAIADLIGKLTASEIMAYKEKVHANAQTLSSEEDNKVFLSYFKA